MTEKEKLVGIPTPPPTQPLTQSKEEKPAIPSLAELKPQPRANRNRNGTRIQRRERRRRRQMTRQPGAIFDAMAALSATSLETIRDQAVDLLIMHTLTPEGNSNYYVEFLEGLCNVIEWADMMMSKVAPYEQRSVGTTSRAV